MKNNEPIATDSENVKNAKGEFNDELVRKFDDILEKGEKIVNGYKPVRSVVFFSRVFTITAFYLFFYIASMLILLLPKDVPDDGGKIVALIVLNVLLAIILFGSIWFSALYYKNTFFVYTTKRIIIRTGIFGIDFLSLDLKNIGASDVYVSLIDKMLRKNTGTIKFGSNSSPMNGGQGASTYGFFHIEKPYEVYREIKDYIRVVRGEDEE